MLVVALRKGLDETVARLESDAKLAPQNLRAEISVSDRSDEAT